jgi:uncharacterized LabA/DUF88 family protein
MEKKKTIFYIDGFNLYHGLLKNTRNQWLDLERFATALLPRPEEHEIIAVKYFTARIKYNPAEPQAAFNQDRYLEALGSFQRVKIVEGFYKRFRVKLPFAAEPCKSCGKVPYGIVYRTVEKRSDVNLATEMMADAYRKVADSFVIVSGDVDFAAPLCFIRHEIGLRTLVFNPHEEVCGELRRFTSYYKNIPRDLPARCQLPDEVTLTNGRMIHRPPAWA